MAEKNQQGANQETNPQQEYLALYLHDGGVWAGSTFGSASNTPINYQFQATSQKDAIAQATQYRATLEERIANPFGGKEKIEDWRRKSANVRLIGVWAQRIYPQ